MSKAPIVDPLSTTHGDEALYGAATLPPVRANAVQKIAFDLIRPDWKQPRRAIPVTVTCHDWKTVNIRRLLGTWITQVCTALSKDVVWMNQNLPKWLRSSQPLPDLLLDKAPGVAVDFFELVSLAASIFSHGLTNPITVVQEGDHYVIETGERRFLAYNLLSVHLLSDGKWDSIPALVVQQSDVWRQAAENGSRQPLNAIGMARQIALLVMDMYRGERGVKFDRFEELVLPGECDQRFYAQVKNGLTYPIKKGELERVLAVTGLKSSGHVSLYRALLDLDPELWVKADRENLAEGAIRVLRAPEKPAELPAPVTPSATKPAPVRYERDPEYAPEQEDAIEVEQAPALTLQVNDRVLVDGTREGAIRYVDARKGTYGVFLDASRTTHHYAPERVTFVSRPDRLNPWKESQPGSTPQPESSPDPEPESQPATSGSSTIVELSLAQDDQNLTDVLQHCHELSELLGLPERVHITLSKLALIDSTNVLHMQRNPLAAEKVLDMYENHLSQFLEGLQARLFTYLNDIRTAVEQSS